MAFRSLTEDERRHLLDMLSEDKPEAGWWMERLRELRSNSDISAFSSLVKLLVNLIVSEREAERLLGNIFKHREMMARALDRDPGLRVAAIDYLSNIEPRLTNPKIVEMTLYEQTLQCALTDPLTGLANRRSFHESLEREVARSMRHNSIFSLLLLDLDWFKKVNDTFGHLLGDVTLKKAARIFRSTLRDVDMVSRLGGDEFAVILAETERLGSYVVADRIRRRVEEEFRDRQTGGADVRLTLSGGIAMFPEDGEDASRLLEHADESLYEAKRHGKNAIILYYSERRAAVRYKVRSTTTVLVRSRSEESGVPALGLNLSRSGALVETDDMLDDCSDIMLVLEENGKGRDSDVWETSGTIVRREIREDRPGKRLLGIAFDRPLPDRCLENSVMAYVPDGEG